jgi:hypothetical protein
LSYYTTHSAHQQRGYHSEGPPPVFVFSLAAALAAAGVRGRARAIITRESPVTALNVF